jgi:lysozyme family protein
MADFKEAYTRYIQPNEGGYANVSADKGGETYAGISRAFNPTWEGWIIIDFKKDRYANRIIPHNTKFPDIQFLVERFYLNLWDRNHFAKIKTQYIANLLYDYFVHSGSYAIKAIQRLTLADTDGIMGPKTVLAINTFGDQEKLHRQLKEQRRLFLQSLINADPSQQVFAKGWSARLAGFPDFGDNATILILLILSLLILSR